MIVVVIAIHLTVLNPPTQTITLCHNHHHTSLHHHKYKCTMVTSHTTIQNQQNTSIRLINLPIPNSVNQSDKHNSKESFNERKYRDEVFFLC